MTTYTRTPSRQGSYILLGLIFLFVFLSVLTRIFSPLTRNVFTLFALDIMMNSNVNFEEQFERLDSTATHYARWQRWDHSTVDILDRSQWMQVVTRLLDRRYAGNVVFWRNVHNQFQVASSSIQPQNTQEIQDWLEEASLRRELNYIYALYLKSNLIPDGAARKQLAGWRPQHELQFVNEDGFNLVGFDLVETDFLLGGSLVRVVLHWISPSHVTDADDIIQCGKKGDKWVWYCYEDRVWAVGEVKNLFENGSFELAMLKSGYPYGYSQTYPDSIARLSTQVELGSDSSTNNTTVCINSDTNTRSSLASKSVFIEDHTHYILTASIRFEKTIAPRLGLYWRSSDEQSYTFLPTLNAESEDWLHKAGVFTVPTWAEEVQLRLLFSDTYGEMCVNHVVLVAITALPIFD
jgi:hypothetical protein